MNRFTSASALGALLVVLSAGAAGTSFATPTPVKASTARMTPGFAADMASLPATKLYGGIVHFHAGTTATSHRTLISSLGLRVGQDFEKFAGALYVLGPVSAFQALTREPSVRYLERLEQLPYLGDTANWATRVRVMQEPVAGGPYFDAQGRVLDGTGVGIAIVDSGVNAPHPDFADHTARNFRVTCPNPLVDETALGLCVLTDLGTTLTSDNAGGHGTHCAGIALGDGTASSGGYPVADAAPAIQGTYTGVAPGASLYAFGAGAGLNILNIAAAASFNWVLENNPSLDVKIRVVSNSYGGDGPYDPESLVSKLSKQLAESGVVMVYAAGNDGGAGVDDGSEDPSVTSSYCRDPVPGTICVANYNDLNSGARNSVLDTSSSRAAQGRLGDYPDIAAPGALITAACNQSEQPGQAVCSTGAETTWQPYYGTISGTSMAAPHVAGIVALIAQARPELSAVQIEDVIKDTAIKVNTNGIYEADPSNPDGTLNFGLGAGLADAPSIMAKLGVAHGSLPAAGQETLILDGDEDGFADGAGDVVRLTVQDSTVGGLPGLRYRLTLRDATEFLISTTYGLVIQNNVGGVALKTQVNLTAEGVTVPEAGAGNNAVATQATLDGNVVSVFVPFLSMAYPQPLTPVHNLRVQVLDLDTGLDADYAPSPADTPAQLAALQPMFGRPYTIQLPGPLPPVVDEKSCLLPGITMATSPAGYNGTAGLPTAQDDLRQIWFAEPSDMEGKLVVTLKMDNLSPVPPPNHRWSVYLRVPGDVAEYFVAMDTAQGPLPVYNYGTRSAVDTPAAALGTFTVLGDLDPASTYNTDGTITLVIDKASFPTPIVPGMELFGIAGAIRETTTSVAGGVGLTADSAGATRNYVVAGTACLSGGGPVAPPGGGGTKDGTGGGGDRGGHFGGALGLGLLLPLLGLAALRRRRV